MKLWMERWRHFSCCGNSLKDFDFTGIFASAPYLFGRIFFWLFLFFLSLLPLARVRLFYDTHASRNSLWRWNTPIHSIDRQHKYNGEYDQPAPSRGIWCLFISPWKGYFMCWGARVAARDTNWYQTLLMLTGRDSTHCIVYLCHRIRRTEQTGEYLGPLDGEHVHTLYYFSPPRPPPPPFPPLHHPDWPVLVVITTVQMYSTLQGMR